MIIKKKKYNRSIKISLNSEELYTMDRDDIINEIIRLKTVIGMKSEKKHYEDMDIISLMSQYIHYKNLFILNY